MTNSPQKAQPSNSAPKKPPSGLEQRLLGRFRALGLSGDPLIAVGFSGGADSLCLAAALGGIRRIGGFRVRLVHVDHGIRAESARDAERAQELATRLGLPIKVTMLAPGLAKRTAGLGIEEAGRRERYLAFSETCVSTGADLIALAHHQQDQAESVLLHLVRGAGLSGASAMAELTAVKVPWWIDGDQTALRIWRPLLREPKSEIDSLVGLIGLDPVEDETNADTAYLRNWLRREMLPKLEVRKPGSTTSLARFAEIAAHDNELLESLAGALRLRATDEFGGLIWSRIETEPIAIQRRVVRAWLTGLLPHQEIPFERVEAVPAFAMAADPEKLLQLGGNAIAVWDRGCLVAGRVESVTGQLRRGFDGPIAPDDFQPARLQSGLPFLIDGWGLTAHGVGTLQLRTARPGDALVGVDFPIREWARRHGLHPFLRNRIVVAVSGDGVVWAAGQDATDDPVRHEHSRWRFELIKLEESE